MTAPILLFGVTQRVGTHFLYELLLGHPDCVPVAEPDHDWAPRWEDALLPHAHLLEAFVAGVHDDWNPEYDRDGLAAMLRASLGGGVLRFLTDAGDPGDAPGRRVVTKHPGTVNLHLLPRFLPDCVPLLLVRDGRSSSASAAAGAGTTYEVGIRKWANGARRVADFVADGHDHVLVRYEDLVADTEAELRRILTAYDLDPDRYPFDAVDEVPVIGSSYHDAGEGKLHWMPVERPPDFAPVERHADWPPRRRRRFDHLAGDLLDVFGYPRDGGGDRVVDDVLDVAWRFQRRLRGRTTQP